MYVSFLTFNLEVDTATDCHLQYEPIRCSTGLADLDYVQPKKANACSALVSVAPTTTLVLVEPDDNNDIKLPLYASHYPKKPPSPLTLLYNLTYYPPPAYSVSIKDLDHDKLIQRLYSLEYSPPSVKNKLAPTPLLCMTQGNIIQHLHHSGTILPQVCPCDTPNESDAKFHWTARELHRVMGCH
jgi:hypothetical protein